MSEAEKRAIAKWGKNGWAMLSPEMQKAFINQEKLFLVRQELRTPNGVDKQFLLEIIDG
jgi:hypothetical protein